MKEDDWLKLATKFELGECRIQRRPIFIEIRKQIDGSVLWIVSMHEWVLTKSGKWIYESMPSGRTDSFIKRTRYATKDEALESYRRFVKKNSAQVLMAV